MMEKHSWHRVHLNLIANSQPVPRWGHSCCVIGNQIVFFGGYAESIYMNDVWSFNTTTMEWTQIKTTGDIPSQRSNCTMSYDSENDRVIVFGGGGPNKKRFNTVNILNWMTKEWIQIHPKENEPAPWERTYHSAQLFYPYLVVFGGEGISDIDDLWVFNFLTLSWKEVHIDKTEVKPCARRFHSSVKIGNEFYIIGGCHGKYRCLSDIYSLDLAPLLQKGDFENLKWVNRKPVGSAFLTRWGHSCAVYDKKIYIFGGRFSNDLNDLLVFDPIKNSIKTLKTSLDLPKARRRHSACFIGSCMVVFGGFNGEYFNDLNYINVFELKSRFQTIPNPKSNMISKMLKERDGSDGVITSREDTKIYIHKGLLSKGFENDKVMEKFLSEIDQNFQEEKITEILTKIYLGYGEIDTKTRSELEIYIPDCLDDYEDKIWEELCPNNANKTYSRRRLGSLKSIQNVAATISLPDEQFNDFLEKSREDIRKDVNLVVNKTYVLPSNKACLALGSTFFKNCFSSKFKKYSPLEGEFEEVYITLPNCSFPRLNRNNSTTNLKTTTAPNIVLFQILLNFLLIDKVVIPIHMSAQSWFELYSLAEYFCLDRLMSICEKQLCLLVDEHNSEQILEYALIGNIKILTLYCADYFIKTTINRGLQVFPQEEQETKLSENESETLTNKRNDVLEYMYNLARFDILQIKLERIKIIDDGLKRKQSQSTQQQKENYQINCNY